MIKYFVVAAALKLFSTCTLSKNVYRILGNTIGKRKRLAEDIPEYYIQRVNRMLKTHIEMGIDYENKRIMEIGTGWCHWEGIIHKIFFDVNGVLFDVWDNRQLDVMKSYMLQLLNRAEALNVCTDIKLRACNVLNEILLLNSFEEIYEATGFRYVVEPNGRLSQFESQSFDMIVSAGVLEHIHRSVLERVASEFYRLLKPGGYSIHSINMTDHLHLYDKSVSAKKYLQYSDRIWKLFFENEVQYFNRVQRPEWKKIFSEAGFQLLYEEKEMRAIEMNKRNIVYKHYDEENIDCTNVYMIQKKI
jgi:SAM-dependent methyltransferase